MFQQICAKVDTFGGDSATDVIRISTSFEMNLFNEESIHGSLQHYKAANPHHISVIERIIAEVYRGLGLIQIYTASEEEVKCYLIKRGKTVMEASNLLDVFIARNFIRGDVISFDDYFKFQGDRVKLMIEGKLKAETKKYLVNDGDIIEFRYHGEKK